MRDDDDDFAAQWRRFENMARKGFDRLTGWSDATSREGFGNNLRMGRMLAAGDVRLVALFLIEQQPRHGYDLIKAIEEHSHGFYAPSPGMIYPALTYLEEAGYVTSQSEANKKLYTITDVGRTHLADNRDAIATTLGFLAKAGERMNQFRDMANGDWKSGNNEGDEHKSRSQQPDRDMKDVLPEVNEARRALKAAIAEAVNQGEAAQREAARIMKKAADKIVKATSNDIDL
ncbi:PadR family transcriptional regulator [Devosia rhodophyticola]|uniref:PadR family transcriptional regulator n=1 Tax=Devosia rhodophyticola TaxID=3026423 RepID=A0ABY7Z1A5_9HYPH|nr:PadR family transcriptional regulator [Devosia rhodophyticola]WDR07406.1 PadR family transcriptional regulator [Devosia rhodophyticola]